MKFPKLLVASAALLATLGGSIAADAKDHRPRHGHHRYERDRGANYRNYRADRDRRYDRRYQDRRRYDRNRSYGDVARRNYEHERDLQTCYRNGRRICP